MATSSLVQQKLLKKNNFDGFGLGLEVSDLGLEAVRDTLRSDGDTIAAITSSF